MTLTLIIIWAIIVVVVGVFITGWSCIRIGAKCDFKDAVMKCKDCKYFIKELPDIKEVYCSKWTWMTVEEVFECEDKEKKV